MKNLLLSILLFPTLLFAQNKFTVSGTVKDAETGEGMIGAIVHISELKGVGTSTNAYGFYSITIPEGTYTLNVNIMGYTPSVTPITLDKNITLDISIAEEVTEMQEVVITGEKPDDNVTKAQMGVLKLDIKDVNKIPVLFGEKDIIKSIQLMPGIKTAGEGNTGFYVRGGGADQNLILLDEAPVYNASHLLGFFSVFNSDAIKDVTIYKGGMPAQYGGRLSSVLDVKMNDGNTKKYGVSGGIGLISSKLNIEGPLIKKEKGSFIVSARRTYADAFLKLSSNPSLNSTTLYFYDFNLKANYQLNAKNKLMLSGYFGRDKLGFSNNSFGIDWGNATGTIRWNKLITPKWFSNTMAIFSNYSYKIHIASGANDFTITSRIRDYNFKQEFEYFASPRSNIKLGVNVIYHKITPGQITVNSGGINPTKLQDKYAFENAIYATHEWNATEKLNITYGLRISSFSLMGPGDIYTYDASGTVSGTTNYNTGSVVKTYINPEPRISSSYKVSKTSSVKASIARNAQYLHLISNSTTTSPTDVWIPTSNNVKPELATQYSVGYFKNFKKNKYEFSTEVYYKDLQNQIDYKNGANTRANDKIEGELLYGKGRAYGIEFFLKKKYGKLNGWIGYTLSRSERHIDQINNNNWYLARQDRPHDLSIVAIYDLHPKWSLSSTFVFYNGNAVTFPSGKYKVDGEVQFLYTERNGYRMPNYHRLDIAATWQRKKTEKFESSWSFSIYNLYGRENAYTITFEQDPNDASRTQAVQTALFKMVPSVSYNFKF